MLDLVSDILTQISMQGTLYFRTSFSKPWGVAVPSYENVARFHFAQRGSCFVRVAGQDAPVHMEQGDLIIIPLGAEHALYCGHDPENTILPLDQVLEISGYSGQGALVYGGNDPAGETHLICGHFSFQRHARHMLIDQLPPLIHLKNYGEVAGKSMESTLRVIGDEAGKNRLGGDLIALEMSEVIFAQAIRGFLESEAAALSGLAGFSDPNISRALDAFHKTPSQIWTIERLARAAGLSRTGFAVLFQKTMGVTPMQYVTSWRIEIAKTALLENRSSVADAAEIAGYASDSAFARVFKKETGFTPAGFRRQQNMH